MSSTTKSATIFTVVFLGHSTLCSRLTLVKFASLKTLMLATVISDKISTVEFSGHLIVEFGSTLRSVAFSVTTGMQALDPLLGAAVPAVHWVHALDPVLLEKVPVLHKSHALDPLPIENVPALHWLHPLAPFVCEKLPALHARHCDCPETLAVDPAGHIRHVLDPLRSL